MFDLTNVSNGYVPEKHQKIVTHQNGAQPKGGNANRIFISEPGLYRAISHSTKPCSKTEQPI